MEGWSAQACWADKGDDADAFLRGIKERGIKAIIPPKANRKEPRDCDGGHYKERHAVECMFGTLKYFRRIARRYEKTAINFRGMRDLAATLLRLR